MSAPNKAFDGLAAYKACPSPCTPECPKRTATCKFDGNCNKYAEWKVEYEKTRLAVQQRYAGERGAANMLSLKKSGRKYQASTAWNKKYEKRRD